MSLIAKYSDRTKIIPQLRKSALKETEHFRNGFKPLNELNKANGEIPDAMPFTGNFIK